MTPSRRQLLAALSASGAVATEVITLLSGRIPDSSTSADNDDAGRTDINRELINTKQINDVFYASDFGGSDGGDKIQSALNAASDNPGTNAVIIGPNGPDNPFSAPERDVWEISSNINLEGLDNIHLIGRGYPLLFLADSTTADIIRSAADDSGTLTENVCIEGIRFHGNRANQPQKGDVGFRDPDNDGYDEFKGLTGVRPIHATNWTIENCTFKSFQRFGVCIKLAESVTVRNCRAEDCGDDGFTASNQQFASTRLNNIVFDNIRASNNGDQGIEIEDGCDGVRIINSHFENNPNGGIVIKSHPSAANGRDEEPCINVTISNCDLINNSSADIGIKGSFAGTTRNIIISNCHLNSDDGDMTNIGTDRRQTIRNVTVKDCHYVLNGAGHALTTQGTTGQTLEDVTVDIDVFVKDTQNASWPVRFTSSRIENLNISASIRFADGGHGEYDGIQIRSGPGNITDVTIEDSTFVEGAGRHGLYILSTGGDVRNVRVGGTYKNNNQNETDGAGIGVNNFGTVVQGIRFIGVRAYDDQDIKTQEYGISRGGGEHHIYDSCDLRGNAAGAFDAVRAATSVAGDNILNESRY